MTIKHTPGPWTFSMDQQFGDLRFYVAQAEGAPYTPDYSDVATLIAETVSGERRLIQEANARLISVAPELLADLREAAATLRRYEALYRAKNTEYSIKRADANAALAVRFEATISKATGESA